jgi:hypothetical protein
MIGGNRRLNRKEDIICVEVNGESVSRKDGGSVEENLGCVSDGS